jgi:hypothetical protein
LLAGELRYCLRSASSAEASLHATLAASRGIFVRCRFPMAGRSVRAADSRFPMPQFFAGAALIIEHPAWHARRLVSRRGWPKTPCAHRLGEPNRIP